MPPESLLDADQQQSLLYSSDLELGETTKLIFEAVERVRPSRVVLDSLSEIRLLAQSSLRYRRQILALKHYFARHGATVLLLDDLTTDTHDKTVHSVAHGVIRLEELAPDYGAERRRLRVIKYRGQAFRGGYHDFTIETGGVQVFPRLVAAEHRSDFARARRHERHRRARRAARRRHRAGLEHADAGAGRRRQVAARAAVRRRRRRARREGGAVHLRRGARPAVRPRQGAGHRPRGACATPAALLIEQIDAAELSPGEFAHGSAPASIAHDVRTVVIDSLNGYQAAMPEEQFLILHMHELLQYLNRQGAATFLTVAQHGLVGDMKAPVDVTYLADTVILLRYFEALGRVRRAISVIKKRTGAHEDTIREIPHRQPAASLIGAPLAEFQGVLRGIPTFTGSDQSRLSRRPRACTIVFPRRRSER